MNFRIKERISNYLSSNPDARVCALDLETLVADSGGFLKGERIISISMALDDGPITTSFFSARDDSAAEEMRILREFDLRLAEIAPDIIIGYNHTGYDIPLIKSKLRELSYSDRLRNVEYFFGVSWTVDMKYVIAEDLYDFEGNYRIRKLDDVLRHERYGHLNLMRAKELVTSGDIDKGSMIKQLWKEEPEIFERYSIGDSYDLIVIFSHIFSKSRESSQT